LRAAAADVKVEAALEEAANLLNRNEWLQAKAAATRARELQESGAGGRWKDRIDEMLADVDLVIRLDEVRLLQTNYHFPERTFHREKPLPRFAEEFARYGIRPGDDPAEVAARIARRPAPVRDALVAGLENWWLLASGHHDPARDWLSV